MDLQQIEAQLELMTKTQAESFSFLGAINERFVFQTKAEGEGATEPLTDIYNSVNDLSENARQELFSNMNTINYSLGGSGRPCK